MSIQGLLQKGTSDCGRLEKTADALLTLPRFLWLGREVTLQTKNHKITKEEQGKWVGNVKEGDQTLQLGKDREPSGWAGNCFGIMVAMVLYPLAIPFLAVGLACKKISLLKDAKAKNYHEVVEASVKDAELIEKQKKLGSSRQYHGKEIDTLKINMNILRTRESIPIIV